MQTMKIESYGLNELKSVVEEVLKFGKNIKAWSFEGDLGAGKTTMIKEICRQAGVEGKVASPTFSLVNEYETSDGEVIYHFDFYRIKTESEAMDIGVEEYFYSGNLCLIEWPSQIPNLIPENRINIKINTISESARTLILERHEK